jgi:hypothetical protein
MPGQMTNMDEKFLAWLHELTQICYHSHVIIDATFEAEIQRLYEEGLTAKAAAEKFMNTHLLK